MDGRSERPGTFFPFFTENSEGAFSGESNGFRQMDFSPLLSLLPPWQFLNIEGQALQRVNAGTFEPVSL